MAVRPFYSNETITFLRKYANGLYNVSCTDKQEKIRLQKEIFVVRQSILKLREEIRNSRDKFSASEKIDVLKVEKSKLVGKLKKLSEKNPFLKLNAEEKSALCLSVLLQKYLAKELDNHSELLCGRNEKGEVTVNVEALKASELFRQIQHINDFVAAYVGNHADKVTSSGYFITLLGNNKNWQGLYAMAEAYFEKQRYLAAKNPEMQNKIKASRAGVEIIKTYPESGLQAVRLLTKEALDYEGKEMGHCIGGGSYDKYLEDGSRQYYSIRELSADGEWKPHVTFECEKDKIRQCKGKADKAVIGRYLNEARDFAAHIIGQHKLSSVNKNKVGDWKNLGYTSDKAGNLWDLYGKEEIIGVDFSSLHVQCDDLAKWPTFKNVKVESLVLNGVADRKVWDKVCEFSEIGTLNLNGVQIAGETEIDLLRKKEAASYHDLILPGTLLKYIRSFEGCRIGNLRIVGKVDETGLAKLGKSLNVSKVNFERAEFENVKKVDFSNCVLLPEEERIDSYSTEEDGIFNIKLDIDAELKKCGCVVMEEIPAFSFEFADEGDINVEEWHFPQNVTALDFVNLTGAAVRALKPECYTQLKHLVMKFYPSVGFYVNPVDNGLDWKELPVPRNIEELEIANFRPKRGEYADFTIFPRLRRLDLQAVDFSHVGKVNFNNPNLEQLDLSNSRLSGIKELDLSSLYKLKVFNVSFLQMDGIEKFKLPDNLESISIMHNKDFCRVMDFHNCQRMKKLSLLVADVGNRKLEDILPPNLEELYCDQLLLDNAETLDLTRYDKLKSIQVNTLKAENLKKISLPHSCEKLFMTMAEAPELQEWNLAECGKLNDVTLMAGTIGNVAELRLPSSLRRLNLGGLTMPELKILDLSRCRMTERLTLHAFNAPKLERVYMPECIENVMWVGYKFPARAKISVAPNADEEFCEKLKEAMSEGQPLLVRGVEKHTNPTAALAVYQRRGRVL